MNQADLQAIRARVLASDGEHGAAAPCDDTCPRCAADACAVEDRAALLAYVDRLRADLLHLGNRLHAASEVIAANAARGKAEDKPMV